MISESTIHLLAGGTAGTLATVLTCPLEVIKTRLQSSLYNATYDVPLKYDIAANSRQIYSHSYIYPNLSNLNKNSRFKLVILLRHTFETEGIRGLFKGLGPNLIGVAPARAIYFCTYSNSKQYLSSNFKLNKSFVFLYSATIAGFLTSTLTNPIWFIKTKLQLDQSKTQEIKLSVIKCIKDTYKTYGIAGFYKGVTASYYGVSETAINFLIYESLKEIIIPKDDSANSLKSKPFKTSLNFIKLMMCASISKTFAATVAYPHEVARTRLREGKDKYKTFWQTIRLIVREESWRGVYKGLGTHLLRQIPNTAITLATYETLAYFMTTSRNKESPLISENVLDAEETSINIPDDL